MENQVADITKRYSKVQDSFNQVLKESAFKSISDYQAAKLTKEEQNELRELVERYNNTYLRLTNQLDRKSTRLNSSHVAISYAVFCLKKKRTYKMQMGKQMTLDPNNIHMI